MDSLFRVKFNWPAYFAIIIALRLIFLDMNWPSYFAITIALHQFILLFNSFGSVIPVRYLFGFMMCLQMLIGPTFAYNGLDRFQVGTYKMQIPEADYFAYAIPAVICFILGLHIRAGRLDGEVLDVDRIKDFVQKNVQLSYVFIGVGFVSSIVSNFFSSDIGFVFYLLGGFKFIGLFMIILGNQYLKPVPLIIVFGSIISSSLAGGLFHDLLTWMLFLGAVYAIKYKPTTNLKALVTFGFLLLTVVIQQLKGDYRSATWQRGEQSGIETFTKAYEGRKEKNTLFSFESLAPSNIRINQGFIITNIMSTVPEKVPFENGGELYQILEAAFLPRVIAPNKLNAGDRDLFMKYSGIRLQKGTSMGLSSMGDAYINFGIFGGCIFMFVLGFIYSEVLNAFKRGSRKYPILLLFTCLVFYYPIRPDCELQTILGHLVKSCFLIFIVFQIWKATFEVAEAD